MNVEILRSFIENILRIEDKFKIQDKIKNIQSNIVAIVNLPQDEPSQKDLTESILELRVSLNDILGELSPKDWENLDQIDARKHYSADIIRNIELSISKNSMSPSVVRDELDILIEKRDEFIRAMNDSIINFSIFGIDSFSIQEGHAEIGFQIPREIFDNNLDGLIKELKTLRFIVTTFSISVTGRAQEIEITQISTSDPIIYFDIAVKVVAAIGAGVSWALHTWK